MCACACVCVCMRVCVYVCVRVCVRMHLCPLRAQITSGVIYVYALCDWSKQSYCLSFLYGTFLITKHVISYYQRIAR